MKRSSNLSGSFRSSSLYSALPTFKKISQSKNNDELNKNATITTNHSNSEMFDALPTRSGISAMSSKPAKSAEETESETSESETSESESELDTAVQFERDWLIVKNIELQKKVEDMAKEK